MALSNKALTTLAAAKTCLNIAQEDTSQDSLLELLLESLSAGVENYCARAIARRDISSEPQEFRGRTITLDQYPVITLDKVLVNGVEIPVDKIKLDAPAGILRLPRLACGVALRDYSAGFCDSGITAPADIQLALWKWLELVMNRAGSEGIRREDMGDYLVQYADETQGPPPLVATLLEIYRSERV